MNTLCKQIWERINDAVWLSHALPDSLTILMDRNTGDILFSSHAVLRTIERDNKMIRVVNTDLGAVECMAVAAFPPRSIVVADKRLRKHYTGGGTWWLEKALRTGLSTVSRLMASMVKG